MSDSDDSNYIPQASPASESEAEVDNEADEFQVAAPPAAAAAPMALSSVWDHPLVEIMEETTAFGKIKKSWKCLAPGCYNTWSGLNTTKALAHGSRDPGYCKEKHVKPCTGTATPEQINLFGSFLKGKLNKKAAKKRGSELVAEDILASTTAASQSLKHKKSKTTSGGFASANSSLSCNSTEGGTHHQLDVVTSFEKSTIDGCNAADLDAAIAQMVYCKALPFSFGECPYFQRVIQVARTAPKGYVPPKRKTLCGDMLDIAYESQLKRDLDELLVDSEIFGIGFFGDAATIHKCSLINIFACSFHCPAIIIDIIDCHDRIKAGEKKDGTFISNLFIPIIQHLDALKDKADIIFFDGGSNFQLAGKIIEAHFPRLTVVHGLEHVLSLVFEDIAKIPVVKQLTLQVRRLYRTFGSGSNHKPHAFFINQSKLHNKGRIVCLLRAAETRFASFFYAMHRAVRCKKALEATVHSAAWSDMKRVKAFILRAAKDVDDKLFWKRLFVLLHALYPLLKLLRRADSNEPNMDKICYYLNQTRLHLIKSKDDLMDEELFPPTITIDRETEEDATYEDDEEYLSDDDAEGHGGDDEGIDIDEEDLDVYTVDDEWGGLVTDESKGIYKSIMDAISHRTPKMEHDFALTAWACSIRPDIMADAKSRLDGNGSARTAIERCIRKLLSNDVDAVVDGEVDQKIDTFWDELKHFQNRTGVFNRPNWFNSLDCISGHSAKWHEKYSRHYTTVFGYIACRVTSKICGSGGSERGWSDTKVVKTGKRAHLSSDKVKKQGALYTSANVRRARIKTKELEKTGVLLPDAVWGDDDEQFDLGLEKWGVDVQELKKPLGPRRLLRCWIEDWENVFDQGEVMRVKLLNKYGGLVFDDIDAEPPVRMRVSTTKMKYIRRSGWHVMGEPPEYIGDGTDEDILEPFAITEKVMIELLKNTEQDRKSVV